MRRRHFIAAAGLAAAAGIAGCRAPSLGRDPAAGDAAGTPTPTPMPVRTRIGDVELPVSRAEMRQPLPRDRIPAIVDPAFGDGWAGREGPDGPLSALPPEAPVVGVARAGGARAYPLRVLNRHEVVNDRLGGPLLVTYCVLCGSAVAADRTVAGGATRFGVSGWLWRSDLVMYDEATDSLWSQLLAAAIRGPRTGERLSLVPASLTTLGAWRDRHPATRVLLPPPRSGTLGSHERFDYGERRYGYGDEPGVIGHGPDADGDRHPKTLVIGVTHGGEAVAYPYPAVTRAEVVNDRVGGLPVVVTVTPGGSLAAYRSRVDGRTLRFRPAGPDAMHAGGSIWGRGSGRAREGPHAGRELPAANDIPPLFWRGWRRFHPDTRAWSVDAAPVNNN